MNDLDEVAARNHSLFIRATVTNVYDVDRSGSINATDQIFIRNNATSDVNATRFISVAAEVGLSVPEAEPLAPAAIPAIDRVESADSLQIFLPTDLRRHSQFTAENSLWLHTPELLDHTADPRHEAVEAIFEHADTRDHHNARKATPTRNNEPETVDEELLDLLIAGVAGQRRRPFDFSISKS